MCIAIMKPAGKDVSDDAIKECFKRNPDGAGFAWHVPSDDHIEIQKGFFNAEMFIAAYRENVTTDHTAMLHFRIATIGPKNEENCQPFRTNHGVLSHNGPCLNRSLCSGTKSMSDSMQFAEELVKDHTRDEIIKNAVFLSYFIGSEKVVFLFNDGNFVIINEAQGAWDGGVWYSNSSYKPYTALSGYAGGYLGEDFDGFYASPRSKSRLSREVFVWSTRLDTLMHKTVWVSQDGALDDGLYAWVEDITAYIKMGHKSKDNSKLTQVEALLFGSKTVAPIGIRFSSKEEAKDFEKFHTEGGRYESKPANTQLIRGTVS